MRLKGLGTCSIVGHQTFPDLTVTKQFWEGLKNQLHMYSEYKYTLRRPVMREVLSTRIWGVPPAGGPLL